MLEQYVCAQSLSYVLLCNPMGCSLPVSSVHGILRARILEWVAISSSRGSSWPRDRTHISNLLNGQAGSLPLGHQGSPMDQTVDLKSTRPCGHAGPMQATRRYTHSTVGQTCVCRVNIWFLPPSKGLLCPGWRGFSGHGTFCFKTWLVYAHDN